VYRTEQGIIIHCWMKITFLIKQKAVYGFVRT